MVVSISHAHTRRLKMSNVQLTTTTSQLARKLCAALAIGLAAMVFIAAGTAHADPKKGSGTAKGCLIENDGKLETVAVGSKIGLFTCGSDGEWHFGWLINARTEAPKKVKPINTVVLHKSALPTARAAR
jgi:hypothetical protein